MKTIKLLSSFILQRSPKRSSHTYNAGFYDCQSEDSLTSAQSIVPIILDFLSPKSVVDVGCGLGTWLKPFVESGVSDVVGLDGEYVDRSRLHISPYKFIPMDLNRPGRVERTFDLAISVEVAEHLSPSNALDFVKFITGLAPVIVFSAAIPGQGGAGHVNELWPSQWANLFLKSDYIVIDVLRPRIWLTDNIQPWYRQNIFFYVKSSIIKSFPLLQNGREKTDVRMLDLVHPEFFRRVRSLEYTPGNELGNELISRFVRRLCRIFSNA